VGWRKNGKQTQTTDLRLKSGDGGDWLVVIGIPGEAMVGVSLSIVSP
jgi:hypothetical protein